MRQLWLSKPGFAAPPLAATNFARKYSVAHSTSRVRLTCRHFAAFCGSPRTVLGGRTMAVRVSILPRGSRPPLVSPNRRVHLVRGETVHDFILSVLPAEACLPTVYLAGAEVPLTEKIAIFRDGEEIIMEWPQPQLQSHIHPQSQSHLQLQFQSQPQLQCQPQLQSLAQSQLQSSPPYLAPPTAPPSGAPVTQLPARLLGRSIAHAAFASSLKIVGPVADAGAKSPQKRARSEESSGVGAAPAAVAPGAAMVVSHAPKDVSSLRKRARRGVRAGKKHKKHVAPVADSNKERLEKLVATVGGAALRADDAGSTAGAAAVEGGVEMVDAVDDFLQLLESGFGRRAGAMSESMAGDYEVLMQAPASMTGAAAVTDSPLRLHLTAVSAAAENSSAATPSEGQAIPVPQASESRRSRVSRSFGLGGVMRALAAGNV